jgi:hypothetical protein
MECSEVLLRENHDRSQNNPRHGELRTKNLRNSSQKIYRWSQSVRWFLSTIKERGWLIYVQCKIVTRSLQYCCPCQNMDSFHMYCSGERICNCQQYKMSFTLQIPATMLISYCWFKHCFHGNSKLSHCYCWLTYAAVKITHIESVTKETQ